MARNALPFFRPSIQGQIRNILVIKFLGIGSIILTAPTIPALRDAFPGANIHYLTFKDNRSVLELLNLADRNIFIDTSSVYRFFLTTLQAILTIRRERIDIAFDFEFFAKFPLIVAMLGGVKQKAGFYLTSEWWRKYLLDYPGYYNHYYHIKDVFLSLVYFVKQSDPYYLHFDQYQMMYGLPTIAPSRQSMQRIDGRLREAGIMVDTAIVVVNPNAGPELAPQLKRWPGEYFSLLMDRLIGAHGDLRIVMVGSRNERPYVQSIIDRMVNAGSVVNMAGETTLGELLSLLSLARVFVTVDSGPMHLASLTQTPIIGFFGAETPVLYRPLGERVTILCKPLYSVPMFTVYNGKESLLSENIPLRSITVEEAYHAVESYLST